MFSLLFLFIHVYWYPPPFPTASLKDVSLVDITLA